MSSPRKGIAHIHVFLCDVGFRPSPALAVSLLAALKADDTAGDDKPPRAGKGTRK
jgi:hypothetical protein